MTAPDHKSLDGCAPKVESMQTPIAIVGLACRLPNSCNSPSDFWEFLLNGRIASCDVPQSRFSFAGHYDGSLRPSTMRSKGGMFLDIDPKDIDAGFFGLSQVDAMSMDPSQRQLLEVVYEGLENAGLTLEYLKRKKYGCFVGSYASGELYSIRLSDWSDRFQIIATCNTVIRKIDRRRTSWALVGLC